MIIKKQNLWLILKGTKWLSKTFNFKLVELDYPINSDPPNLKELFQEEYEEQCSKVDSSKKLRDLLQNKFKNIIFFFISSWSEALSQNEANVNGPLV
jgi:hypothetical protein